MLKRKRSRRDLVNDDNTKYLIQSLYYEGEKLHADIAYQHGLVRAIFVLLRSLLRGHKNEDLMQLTTSTSSSLCIAYFRNEISAAEKHQAKIGANAILKINLSRLNFVVRELGLSSTLKSLTCFIRASIKNKGFTSLSRAAQPALGWLLYRYFLKIVPERSIDRIICTNLLHPSSVAAAWAAKDLGIPFDYCEHAATTKLMLFSPLDYRNYFVVHQHTKEILIEWGISPDRIQLLGDVLLKATPLISGHMNKVGFCINDLDSLDVIEQVTESLASLGFSVVCRVHDADKRFKLIEKVASKSGFSIESARSTGINIFLAKIDLLIAGNSNVIGDALELGVPVIYFWGGDASLLDYYGFAKHYGIPMVRNAKALQDILVNARSN